MELPNEQRRYQVFVSSTYLDLQDERRAVTTALLACDALPAGMELFPATDSDAWSLIQDVINSSDYYLLVIGGKYGSLDPATQMSYTEKEYDYAVGAGKPVMAFLHGNPDSLTVEKSEKDGEMREKLEVFRKKVTTAKHVNFWTNQDGLAGAVALSFNKFTKRHPAVGWIRADQATSSESLRELSRLQARIKELEGQLEVSRTLPPIGIEDLAQGEEEYSLKFWAHASAFSPAGMRSGIGVWVARDMSWNEVFHILGAKLLHEADEGALRNGFNEFILGESYSEAEGALLDHARKSEIVLRPEAPLQNLTLEVEDEAFDTILIQLKALGLIQNSIRPRSVKDSGNYWTLTDYGQTRIVQLRAIKSAVAGG